MAILADNVYCFDDICMLEGAPDTKLCGDLFLILLLRLAISLGPKLLDGEDHAAVLGGGLDETNGTACT